ncbi:MAG: carboxypeptidase regulatory-like domain-containing protein [Prevotellaceae bacterium]|jgi:hypothetical protein|nr:carboxypeptidase regulatory-like domain-containing protein [Prevotellaceae bacterium]
MKLTFFKRLAMLSMALVLCGTVMAQVTTSSMSGRVSETGGLAVVGATVQAVHVPTGTQYYAVTDGQGNYRLANMRPGGPYNVTFSMMGFRSAELTGISLALADNLVLNNELQEESVGLDAVVIAADRSKSNMSSDRAGAITSITQTEIAQMPTISRSINDLTRLTPQAQGQAIGGGNYRQNFITVDGAAFNNAFGIGQNLPGGGSPISIDALDQISVSLTPYDVRQSGFIGSAVNAVTKSGTNEFKGSLYHYFTDDRFRGNKVEDTYFTNPPSETKTYGLTFGGPILKNKLFLFVNYETESTLAPGPSRRPSTNGVADPSQDIARPTASQMEIISNFLRDNYGYETGPFEGYAFESPSKKFLARLDWNIHRDHKFNLRYSYMDSKSPFYPSTSSGFNLGTGGRTGMNAMWFKNTGYFQEQNFSSLSGELNSRFFGGKINNTLRVTYSYQNEPRSTGGITFPFVDIREGGTAYTSFGTEPFSYGNLRQVSTWNITDEITYNLGAHNFTIGLSFETNNIKNGFMPQGTGHYVFDSWSDFATGQHPVFYSITYPNTSGYEQVFPGFKFNQFSWYLQDEFKVNNRLNLTGGIRFDLPIYPIDPALIQTNPSVYALNFNGEYYDTGVMPKTRVMFSPRFGFNYDVLGDRKIIVRGGTGIFTGRIPFVWICSQSGNSGMLQSSIEYNAAAITAANITFNPNIHAHLPTTPPPAGLTPPVGTTPPTIMDPDFKFPSVWKTSLAVDFKLPLGFNASIEGVYNKDINAVMTSNMGLVDPEPINIAGFPDNRLMYPNGGAKYIHRYTSAGVADPNGSNGVQPLLVHNVGDNGYYSSFTFKIEKDLWQGLSGMVAYTHSWAKSLHDGSGDQMLSLWRDYITVNGSNAPELGYAGYVMPNNLIGGLTYCYKGFTTSVFYTGGNDGRASYVYGANIVNDGNTFAGKNLIYVPKDPSEIIFVDHTYGSGANAVTYTAQEQSDAFFAYIDQDPYLSKRKGQYAEKNGLLLPWSHRFDVKFTQDFSFIVANTKHTFQLGLDITNVGNLLNSNWGNRWATHQTQLLEMTNLSSVTPNGSVVPTFRFNAIAGTTDLPTETFCKVVGATSTYRMQFSIRYFFN